MGAHFLIEKDGTIWQTASLYKTTSHVGRLKSRCIVERRCAPTPFNPKLESAGERRKVVPDRYPSNRDAVGIELVGEAPEQLNDDGSYGPVFVDVTDAQNDSLKWLISMLTRSLGISMREIFKHPDVSRKTKSEARSAKW